MPADTQHHDYQRALPQWKRCRCAVDGQDAVHDAGEVFLPKLKDQTAAEYKAYKGRASWFGATGRTLDALVGMVFRVPPMITAPAAAGPLMADATMSGMSAALLAKEVLEEVIEAGRVGLLVEHPTALAGPVTLADASAQGLRPYVTIYEAEDIINWREDRVRNMVQPTLVVLAEHATEPGGDPFEPVKVKQIRALMLEDGRYLQRLYRKDSRDQWVQFGADIVPVMNGRALDYIPFVAIGPEAVSLDVQDPPLLDLVDVNLSHYRSTADLEHGAHFAGLPTAVVSGYQAKDGEKLYIGSATAWVFPDPEAKATFLEFSGQGLQALETRVEKKEAQMAALGARMLAPEKTGVESAGALGIRHNGEASVLAGMAGIVSAGVSKALGIAARWAGIAGDVSITLSRDYVPAGITAPEVTALVAAWQQGAISWNTLFDNLKRGEVISEDIDADAEEARIGNSGPQMTPPAAPVAPAA